MLRALWFAIVFLNCAALVARAQENAPEPAILVADDVELTADRILIARGNVEVFQGDTRLSAEVITYDQATGSLIVSGPIVMEDGPDVTILASQAELSDDLQNGLLTSARMVLNQQLQLAAVELGRTEGRYTQLYRTAVTSCRICEDDPEPPLWQIRARRVVHDQEERQLYFENAQVLVRNVPILYVPRLRLPDPTLDRATGFLIPSIRSTSQLGTGLKVPYFIKIGDHRDLTLTPYLSNSTRTLEFRYRQAFVRGRVNIEGAVSDDDIPPSGLRGYFFANGAFDLRNDYKLRFEFQTVTDNAYLRDYDYLDSDFLRSGVVVDRTTRDEYRSIAYTNYRSLRDDDSSETLPTDILDSTYERRFFPRGIGGEVRLNAEAHAHFRRSDLDVDGPDTDTIVDGRDIVRVTFGSDWRRSYFVGGLESQLLVGAVADSFHVMQDSTFPDNDAEVTPYGSVIFRYPLRRTFAGGAQLLEPIAQAAWSGGDGLNVPNDESTFVEFDEGNLLAISRFPAPDRRERGFALAYGLNWTHFAPDGWRIHMTTGQVLRKDSASGFSATSGLFGNSSDYLVAGQIKSANGVALTARGLFDESFDFAKAEIRGHWIQPGFNVSGAYVYLAADPAEDRDDTISELNFDGLLKLNAFWSASVDWRYDFDDRRSSRAGLGVGYSNECVEMNFSVDRRYTSSSSVEAQTSFGLTLSLHGFSTSPGTDKHARACGKNAT